MPAAIHDLQVQANLRMQQARLAHSRQGQKQQQQKQPPQRNGVFPIAGLKESQPSAVGDHFNLTGSGRYYNPRNINGNQFNSPAVKEAMIRGVRAHTRAQYFRHAGMGAAIRHTLGIEQVPSHVTDYINAQQRMSGHRQNPITVAVNPKAPWTGARPDPEPEA